MTENEPDKKPSPKKTSPRGPWCSIGAWAALILGSAHLWGVINLPPAFIDSFYREQVYSRILGTLGGFCDRFAWSLSGGLLLFALILFTLRFLRLLSTALSPGFAGRVLAAIFRLVVLLAILVHPFCLFWGYNYRATPLEKRLELPLPRKMEIRTLLFDRAMQEMTTLRRRGLAQKSGPLPPLRDEMRRTLKKMGLTMMPLPSRVKFTPIPGMLLISGSLGITSPFTLEAHCEPGLHWAESPFVMAHELAHLAGITGEGEANFLAWHALVTSSHPLHQYCGWLGILPHLASEATLSSRLPNGVIEDYREINRRHQEATWPLVDGIEDLVYHLYLQACGIKGGRADYGQVARLAGGYIKKYGKP